MPKGLGSISTVRRTRAGAALLLTGLAFAVVAIARSTGLLQGAEFSTYDRFFRIRAGDAASQLPVTLVSIREQDLNLYGYPLNDGLLAHAVENLLAAQPRAIGIDLYRDLPVPPGTDALRALIRSNPRVVVIEKVGGEDGESVPPPSGASEEQVGFSDFPVDPGGIVRRGLLYLWDSDRKAHYSFGLRIAAIHLAGDGIAVKPDPDNPLCIRIGAARLCPLQSGEGGYVGLDDRGFQFLIDYAIGRDAVSPLTLQDVVEGRFSEASIRDRVVILGTSATSVLDTFFTPLLPGPGDAPMSGSYLHSLVAGQLIREAAGLRAPLRTLTALADWPLLLIASALGGLVGLLLGAGWAFAAVVSVGVAAIGGGSFVLFREGLWVPPVQIAAAWAGAATLVALQRLLDERNEKKVIRSLFEGMLGEEVFTEIWSQREQFLAQGSVRSQLALITVLMADLKGFSGAAEEMDPVALMDWINEFMRALAITTAAHDGVVDDYAGDGLKADFGIPPRQRNEEMNRDAVNAVRAALAMGEALDRLNERWRSKDLPTGRIRIGINTGPAVLGTLGAGSRVKYTSIGDTVNTASRLESFDKESFASESEASSTRILISKATWGRLGGRFETEDLGECELRGLDKKVHVFRVVRDKSPEH